LKGTISGGGYSPNAYMRTGSGSGFASYGRSSAITASARPFNLNDYLPRDKAKRKLAIRRLASLASARVSPSQIDIFKKVTNRYYQLCLRDALYDCASLRKMKSVNKN
ncbi:MAG: hypothetical protein KDD38_07325, partial [Bdellovibrionales bacterium]|nr:hypothetical protein [Bdellovibrionales bacterium]